MTRPSSLPLLSCVALGAIFLVLSCASSNPEGRILVNVPQGVSGSIHLETCVKSAAQPEVTVDANGFGATAVCPSQDTNVEIIVVRGTQSYALAGPGVAVLRTGDGIPTSIVAKLRP